MNSKTLACFLCNGSHKVARCPQKAILNVLQTQLQEETQASEYGGNEVFDGDDKSCAKINAI